ncbi:toll/interleukin-1 receptor domain-containing protein [Aquisalimonas asiatica]|uniref:TIR domain-containing protein n=1 Tax=Aquisalimonas asiatica TaxID=406100 RepID=A0A1H8PY48_9GAMM|nr:toll/interleukin-1 receptor domain-containing protein [Aquisalimonas asiatica]SEO46942.1 TIR domain-containing protein [Aquisalimonas asiatica]
MEEMLRTIDKRRALELELIPARLANVVRVKHGLLDGNTRSDLEAAQHLGLSEASFKGLLYEAYSQIRALQGVLPVPELERRPPTKVFVSYSWDSEEHKAWVRWVSERLVFNGLQVLLDQWDMHPGVSFTQFMEQSIANADFVLCVFTPSYAEKANNRQSISGTGYEQQIVSGQIMSGAPRSKFVPILRAGTYQAGRECAIPTHFMGVVCEDFRSDEDFEVSLESLLRMLYGKPKYMPPQIGVEPTL